MTGGPRPFTASAVPGTDLSWGCWKDRSGESLKSPSQKDRKWLGRKPAQRDRFFQFLRGGWPSRVGRISLMTSGRPKQELFGCLWTRCKVRHSYTTAC